MYVELFNNVYIILTFNVQTFILFLMYLMSVKKIQYLGVVSENGQISLANSFLKKNHFEVMLVLFFIN